MLLVAKLLNEAGKAEFGYYTLALGLINWIVPLVMFGRADVIERYASAYDTSGRLLTLLRAHAWRILCAGGLATLALIAASPWLAEPYWHLPTPAHSQTYGVLLVIASAVTIVLLAAYQYLAATLRGLRAYSAAAGLDLSCAALLLITSTLAALFDGALALVAAYAVSLLLPLAFYAFKLYRHALALPAHDASSQELPRRGRFAAWALVRLLLVMTFALVSLWTVGFVAAHSPAPPSGHPTPQELTADYALPYGIAQMLAFVAASLWASAYGIAAGSWNRGHARRARVQLLRVGKFGGTLLALLALALLLGRGLLALILPSSYHDAVLNLLPPLLTVFLWYALLGFSSTLADLQERPWLGAIAWAAAVIVQLILCLTNPWAWPAKEAALYSSAAGAAAALLIIAPLLLWRPATLNAAALPLAVLALIPLGFLAPTWVVDYVAGALILLGLGFLGITGLLIRPADRRACRRYLRRRR